MSNTLDYSKILNPQNRYDWVGYYHNQGLDFVFNNREAINFESNQLVTAYGVTQQAGLFAKQNLSLDVDNSQSYAAAAGVLLRSKATTDEEFYQGIALSEMAQSKLSDLFSIIAKTGATPVDSVLSQFRNAENTLIQSELSEFECFLLLGAYSISKFSLVYWDEQIQQGEDAKWLKFMPLPPKQGGLTPADRPTILGEDLKGAIGGAIGGALGGVMVGGVGAGPGAAGGFVAGGIGNSVVAICDMYW